MLADRIICLSPDTAASVERDYGIDPKKIAVIPCSVDVDRFSAADGDRSSRGRHCVFVGRPDTRKGFDLLLAAWPIVRLAVPDAELDVIGWQGMPCSGVTFHGRLPDVEAARIVGVSRVAACVSRLEGFGLAAAEAISAGTPVVATDVDGLRSVVTENVTGLFASLLPVDIAAKLIGVLTDDVLWERLHDGCREHRAAFAPSLETARHLDAFRALY